MQNWKVLSWCFAVWLLFQGPARAADSFSIAPPAAWVNLQTPALAPAPGPATNSSAEGVQILLIDDQVNASQKERFHRVIKKVVNANGVQDCVRLSLDYDPSYQRMVIHDVLIRRGTDLVNCLHPDEIKVIQQERDLDMDIYNGEVSAVLFLEDVRVGDQIEFSYTVRGANPILAGHYVDDFYWQGSKPIRYERFRLLWPADRFLGISNHGGNLQPAIRQSGAVKEYLWELNAVPAVAEEDLLPSWYDAYPWVQLSDFTNWQEVAAWALPLYPSPEHLLPELQQKISGWQQMSTNPAVRLAAALAFVQNEIRYMGIEVGPNSHQPNDPSLVYTRRFGDCKDKAYLFCTLLHALGIDATEALVNTYDRTAVARWLPSPYAFNHVVTRVQIGNKTYWLDPTESHQGGAIAEHFFPDYGHGLLVRAESTGLTAIPQQRAGWPKVVVDEKFVVHGQTAPADYTVRTRAEGRAADQLRENFAEQGQQALEKDYLNYYAQEYPKIKTTQPLEVLDHPEQNIFETVEHYQIQEFWVLSDDKQTYEGEFYPKNIRDRLDEPTTTLRTMPLAIGYPHHDILQTEVVLPEAWPLTNATKHIKNRVMQLDVAREVSGNIFKMRYEYQSLTNFLAADEMPAYVKSLSQMKSALGYSLTWANSEATAASTDQPATGAFNWSIAVLATVYTLFVLAGAVVLYHFRRGLPPILPSNDMAPPVVSGLGGWLILPMLALCLSPVRVFLQIVKNAPVYAPESWHSLTAISGAAYNHFWAPILIGELLVNLTLFVFAILLLVLFFQKRQTFPALYIAFLAFSTIVTTADHYSLHLIPSLASKAEDVSGTWFSGYLSCLIWIPYMRTSKRVKATFVR